MKWRIIKAIIWILVIFGGISYWNYRDFTKTPLTVNDEIVTVTPGSTFRSVLMNAGAPETMTKIFLKNNPPSFGLQAGSYEVPAEATPEVYIEHLQKAITHDISLTFLEGWNIFDIDEKLTESGLIDSGEFIDYAENFCDSSLYPGSLENGVCALTEEFPFLSTETSLEGYLYPDTYAINPQSFTVKSLASDMLKNFREKTQGLVPPPTSSGMSTHELITLASIVEKEEKNSAEKPVVAGILKKRWNEDWMIGADITVCYAHRLTSEQCKLSVTKYLYDENDYNTRQKVGLPAGPIDNPSAETIRATLYSTPTPYYYYLHDISTGEIHYATTDAEHESNKQKYIR